MTRSGRRNARTARTASLESPWPRASDGRARPPGATTSRHLHASDDQARRSSAIGNVGVETAEFFFAAYVGPRRPFDQGPLCSQVSLRGAGWIGRQELVEEPVEVLADH